MLVIRIDIFLFVIFSNHLDPLCGVFDEVSMLWHDIYIWVSAVLFFGTNFSTCLSVAMHGTRPISAVDFHEKLVFPAFSHISFISSFSDEERGVTYLDFYSMLYILSKLLLLPGCPPIHFTWHAVIIISNIFLDAFKGWKDTA